MFEHDNGRIAGAADEKDLKLEAADERMLAMKAEANDEDEEYIEVEKVMETSMNSESPAPANDVVDKCDQN